MTGIRFLTLVEVDYIHSDQISRYGGAQEEKRGDHRRTLVLRGERSRRGSWQTFSDATGTASFGGS